MLENNGDSRKELKELNGFIDAIEIALDYGEKVSKEDYEMFFVINTLRPDTSSAEDIINLVRQLKENR